MPSSGRLQRLKTNDDDLLYLQRRQDSQRQQHRQRHRRELEDLSSGQAVAVYNPSSKTWTTAEVKDKLDEPQSYVVKTTNGSELRHNRTHLKPVAEKQPAKQTSPEDMPVPKELTPSKPPSTDAQTSTDKLTVEDTNTNIKRTSSGRTVKPPTKLNLCVGSNCHKYGLVELMLSTLILTLWNVLLTYHLYTCFST